MDIRLLPFVNAPYWQQIRTIFWRNSKDVKRYFKIKHIGLKMHLKWLKSLTASPPKNIAFFIYANDIPIGTTYFHGIDYQAKTADWGIYIYKTAYRNQGVGDAVLKQCINYGKNELHLEHLFLDVLNTNQRAIHVYEKNNFIKIGQTGDFWRYKLNLHF